MYSDFLGKITLMSQLFLVKQKHSVYCVHILELKSSSSGSGIDFFNPKSYSIKVLQKSLMELSKEQESLLRA